MLFHENHQAQALQVESPERLTLRILQSLQRASEVSEIRKSSHVQTLKHGPQFFLFCLTLQQHCFLPYRFTTMLRCRGNLRRLTSHVEYVCWKCRIQLQQRALCHTTPPHTRSPDPERHNLGHYDRAPKIRKNACSVQNGSFDRYCSATISRNRVHTATTGVLGYDYANSHGTRLGHDPEFVSDGSGSASLAGLIHTEHISTGSLTYSSKSPDAGSKETSVTTKTKGHQELRNKRTVISRDKSKLLLLGPDRLTKLTSAAKKVTGTKKDRTVELQVNRDNAVEYQSFKSYDTQTLRDVLVGPVATGAIDVQWQRLRRLPAAIPKRFCSTILGEPNLGRRCLLLSSDILYKSLPSYSNRNFVLKSSYHSNARYSDITLGFKSRQHASTAVGGHVNIQSGVTKLTTIESLRLAFRGSSAGRFGRVAFTLEATQLQCSFNKGQPTSLAGETRNSGTYETFLHG